MTASDDRQNDGSTLNTTNRNENAQEATQQNRRAVLRHLVAGTVFVAGYSALPKQWTTPLAEFGILPAHATTSGVVKTSSETKQPNQEPKPKTTGSGNFSLIFEMTY